MAELAGFYGMLKCCAFCFLNVSMLRSARSMQYFVLSESRPWHHWSLTSASFAYHISLPFPFRNLRPSPLSNAELKKRVCMPAICLTCSFKCTYMALIPFPAVFVAGDLSLWTKRFVYHLPGLTYRSVWEGLFRLEGNNPICQPLKTSSSSLPMTAMWSA